MLIRLCLLQVVIFTLLCKSGVCSATTTSPNTGSTSGGSGSNDLEVYSDLVSGKRQVIGAGLRNNTLILAIAQMKDHKLIKVDDVYVYQIPVPAGAYNSLPLAGGVLLQTKWPELHKKLDNSTAIALFGLADSKHDYVCLYYEEPNKSPYVFSIDEQKGFDLRMVKPPSETNWAMLTTHWMLHSLAVINGKQYLTVQGYDYKGGEINADNTIQEEGSKYYVCAGNGGSNTSDKVIIQKQVCTSPEPLNWTIVSGFEDESRETLFTTDKMVLRMDKFSSVDNSTNGSLSVKVERIKLSQFFYVHSSNTTGGGRPTNSSGTSKGGLSLGIIIAIVVGVVVLVLLVLMVLICFCYATSDPPPHKKRSRKGHKPSARRKSSRSKGARKLSSRRGASKLSSKVKSKRRLSSRRGASNAAGSKARSGRRVSKASTRRSSLRKLTSQGKRTSTRPMTSRRHSATRASKTRAPSARRSKNLRSRGKTSTWPY